MKKNTISAVGFGTAQEPVVHVGLDVHKRTIYLAARLGNTWLLRRSLTLKIWRRSRRR